MRVLPDQVAGEVVEVVPRVTAAIRAEMRRNSCCEVSVPQLRTLAYLKNYAGASLSDVAEYIGLTLPSMSRLVDGLVERKLVTRETYSSDRRRVTLALTALGQSTLADSMDLTRDYISAQLGRLSDADRETIVRAMRILGPLFGSDRENRAESVKGTNGHSVVAR